MAHDPLSRVASWLTSAVADGAVDSLTVTSAEVVDPIFALIAEAARLDALWFAAQNRGDEIFDALPEDIRKGRVQVSLNGKLGRLLQHSSFASEADLDRWVDVHRRFVMAFVDDATAAEFDRQIGFDQALSQFRAGLEEIKAIRETSGCEAHYRGARDLYARASALADQIREMSPISLAGAIAMLEWGNEDGRLITSVIAGLRDLQEKASRGEAAPIDAVRFVPELAPLAADFIDGVPPTPPPAPDYAPALDLSAFSPADRRLVQEAMEILPFYAAAGADAVLKPEVIGFGEPDER